MSSFIIQSHRGAGDLAPENTLESFRLAWSMNTIPEADVRVSKDGVWVAFHDNQFNRLVKGADSGLQEKGASDLTWDELSLLDVGIYKGPEFEGQHIPRMSDVFDAMKEDNTRFLYVDTKEENIDSLADLAREYGVLDRLILASTVYEQLRRWKELADESGTLLWMGGTEERLKSRFEELRKVEFWGITQLQIHVRMTEPGSPVPFSPSPDFIRSAGEEVRSRGILFQALPIGSDKIEVFHQLMDLGVQSFATDYPQAAVEAMKTWSSCHPERSEGSRDSSLRSE